MSFFSSIHNVDGIPVVTRRPDSKEVLKNKEANMCFSRYFQILRKDAIPMFLIARRVPASYSLEEDEETLWEEHDARMKDLKKLVTEKSEKELLKDQERFSTPESNLLTLKRDLAQKMLRKCRFCGRRCEVKRTSGEKGFCELEDMPQISTVFTHVGEEAELVPSLTVFFAHCNFKCVFCQNYDISQLGEGESMKAETIVEGIKSKWERGRIRNVNWVGGEPTPNLHYILEVISRLDSKVPQIWNSNLYNSLEALKLLEGVIDLWLPDFKYGNNECGTRLSKVPNYFDVVTRNLRWLNERREEILIRHLVLPNHITCCSKPIMQWIAKHMDKENVRVNVMDQYRPQWKVQRTNKYDEISHSLERSEWKKVVHYARQLGLSLTL